MGLNIEQLQNPTRAVTINNESTITQPPSLELSEAEAIGWVGFSAFYWYQIFAQYYAVVEAHKMLQSHGGFHGL